MRSILLLACLIAACTAYTITYTSYSDSTCTNTADQTNIIENSCNPEFRIQDFQTGKITAVTANTLTSCDYSDHSCANLTVCQQYTNNQCNKEWKDTTGSSFFSSMYSWTDDGAGGWNIHYKNYSDDACTAQVSDGLLTEGQCGPEYRDPSPPQSGKITFINDSFLTSCDYADDKCQSVPLCVDYPNAQCSDAFGSFSDKYSWATTDYFIMYSAYTDSVCQAVDSSMTGQIVAHKCAAEYRRAPSSGKITQITADWLISCDYADTTCDQANLKTCENYTNSVCYASSSSLFSNSYVWTADATVAGGWKIMYNSYNDQKCVLVNSKQTGEISYNSCNPEFVTAPQSGMITQIDDFTLTSCDYSDTECQSEVICETYINAQCYGFPQYSFSNKYSWWVGSSAPNTVAPAATTAPVATDAPSTPATYKITYTAYEDNTCSTVDKTMTGEIFAFTCAPEYRNAPASGRITQLNATHLMSCDYSDTECATKTVCEVYANQECYASSSAMFSNKYAWTINADGTSFIIYTSYTDSMCGAVDVSGQILFDVCAAEFHAKPQSGKITFINDQYLTSCDYSDTSCQVQTICVDYVNAACSDSATTSFSDKYSWVQADAVVVTHAPVPSNPTATSDKDTYTILYSAYEDNTCSTIDKDMTGEIYAYTCAPENRRSPASGKITQINATHITSCDYSDTACATQTVCEVYVNAQCYGSNSADFSNKYAWTINADGSSSIVYTSYSDKACGKVDISGPITHGQCAAEYHVKPQSGMITFINDEYLTSCDYSDTSCQVQTVCVNYANSACSDSATTSFSDKYSWVLTKETTSAASSVVASIAFVFAAALAMF